MRVSNTLAQAGRDAGFAALLEQVVPELGEEEVIGAHPYEREWNHIEVESEEVADNRKNAWTFAVFMILES